MPHSIRDFFLNPNAAGGNHHHYSNSNSDTPAGTNNLGHTSANTNSDSNNNVQPRGNSSNFHTTYNTNPTTLPSYTYTNRFLQQYHHTVPNSFTPSFHMPHHPPPQYQHYSSVNGGDDVGYAGVGYGNHYNGGGNADRYNTNYSTYGIPTSSNHGTQSKTVCRMDCRYCSAVVCLRGMKAMLLADTTVELYSTDYPPGSVQLIEKDYTTSNCKCKIRDVACRVCGNVVGYHITQPCQQCLRAPNNGHFWMFHTDGVIGQERLNLDLGKLVQQLIRIPNHEGNSEVTSGSTPASITIPTSATTTTTTTAAAAAGGGGRQGGGTHSNVSNNNNNTDDSQIRSEAATTRLTSISRMQRQQRMLQLQQQIHPPRTLTISPSPATPTRRAGYGNYAPFTTGSATPTTTTTYPMPSTTDRTINDDDADLDLDDPDMTEPDTPLSSAAAALSTLSITQFLQPMKWEQLPHPDLDIDLDPNSLGGEPLFAPQWIELVQRSAETAAANMSLALDQEEETERYVRKMMRVEQELLRLQHRERPQHNTVVETSDLGEQDSNGNQIIGAMGGDDILEELVQAHVELGAEIEAAGEEMEHLIDQVDEFGLTSPSSFPSLAPGPPMADDNKDEDMIMDMPNSGRTPNERTSIRNQQQRQQESEPDQAPAPGREGTPLPLSGPQRDREERSNHSRSSSFASSDTAVLLLGADRCPPVALASAMVAKAAASAAAADAASAANSLLFGRRARRDYDMMCR